MRIEENGSHVIKSPDGDDTTQYHNYVVTQIAREDLPAVLTPRMTAFLHDHADAGPVIASVQDLAAAVQARVALSHPEDNEDFTGAADS